MCYWSLDWRIYLWSKIIHWDYKLVLCCIFCVWNDNNYSVVFHMSHYCWINRKGIAWWCYKLRQRSILRILIFNYSYTWSILWIFISYCRKGIGRWFCKLYRNIIQWRTKNRRSVWNYINCKSYWCWSLIWESSHHNYIIGSNRKFFCNFDATICWKNFYKIICIIKEGSISKSSWINDLGCTTSTIQCVSILVDG